MDPCTSTFTDLLYSSYVNAFSTPAYETKCSILLKDISSKSPGFKKYQPRCLNIDVAKASQSQQTREAVAGACLQVSHSGVFTSSSLYRCTLKWQDSCIRHRTVRSVVKNALSLGQFRSSEVSWHALCFTCRVTSKRDQYESQHNADETCVLH